ncbi:hypothetical protein [Butyrivibrio sp. AE2032]|uniref:hypothetical protein n=1 Tax=Butyrivibrio sp. AE2032 TaxID=1458463 RepID=UPI00055209FC|nr:hypothetical protein [Butyrivibrio sp. AE2032]
MTNERIEIFKEFLRKWDFALMPLMPIAEAEAEWLLKVLEEKEDTAAKKHEYYLQNREVFLQRSKERYEQKKAQAFIKGAKK